MGVGAVEEKRRAGYKIRFDSCLGPLLLLDCHSPIVLLKLLVPFKAGKHLFEEN